jgi:hypothetical protein
VGWVRAHHGDAGGPDERARNGHLERERTRTAHDAAVLAGGVHALEREVLGEALDALVAELQRHVLPDGEHRLTELVQVRARPDLEAHPIFSSGA